MYYASMYCVWIDRALQRSDAIRAFRAFLEALFGKKARRERPIQPLRLAVRRFILRICHERVRPRVVRCRNNRTV